MRQIDKAKFVCYVNYVNLPKKLKYFYCVNRLLSCCLCCCRCCFSLERRAPASFEKCERWKRKCWLKIVSVYKYAHTHRHTVEHTCVFVHIKFILHAKWKSLSAVSPVCLLRAAHSVSKSGTFSDKKYATRCHFELSSSISISELQQLHRQPTPPPPPSNFTVIKAMRCRCRCP